MAFCTHPQLPACWLYMKCKAAYDRDAPCDHIRRDLVRSPRIVYGHSYHMLWNVSGKHEDSTEILLFKDLISAVNEGG